MTRELLSRIEGEEVAAIRAELGGDVERIRLLDAARVLFDELLDAHRLPEFLTLRAYEQLS